MTINLPELPKPALMHGYGERFGAVVKAYYAADQMQAYATQAVEQDRAGRPALTDDQIEPYLRHIPAVVTVGWLQEMIRAVHRDFCFEQDRAGRAADTSRLDWLEAAKASLYTVTHEERRPSTADMVSYHRTCVFDGWCVGMHADESPTPRAAIDAAAAIATSQGDPA